MDLPNSVVRKLAGILDGAAVYNWRTLVECLPEYTHSDAMLFRTAEQQVCLSSSSRAMDPVFLCFRVVVLLWLYCRS